MRAFLEKLGINVPKGGVSFHTIGENEIVFLVGATGRFHSGTLTTDQIVRLKRIGCFGSFGWSLT